MTMAHVRHGCPARSIPQGPDDPSFPLENRPPPASLRSVDASQFDFALPERLIAQTPAEERDHSRLLVFDRSRGRVGHHRFDELPHLLPRRCRIFRNNAAVFRARLRGRRPSGGRVECLLLNPTASPESWWSLARPGRRLTAGSTIRFPGECEATVVETGADGRRLLRFALPPGRTVLDIAEAHGEIPLPPYISRDPDDPRRDLDNERYQTVYADRTQRVAAAAPTAGLHFTPQLNRRLAAAGHRFHDLTLHIGLGTFRPISTDAIEDHPIHREFYALPAETRQAAESPEGAVRLAVGTTVVRALEDSVRRPGADGGSLSAEADIYLYPPCRFQRVDALLTNFHLPRSTLLCLVAAFLAPGSTDGIKSLKEVYAEAISLNYRFFSYGDAMLIL